MDFVCFIGKNRVGKTAMTQSLRGLLHAGSKKAAICLTLADALREDLVTDYGIPPEIAFDKVNDKSKIIIDFSEHIINERIVELWEAYNLIESKAKFNSMKISLLQLLLIHGEDICRRQNKHYFTDRFDIRLKEAISKSCIPEDQIVVVCDDLRNPIDFEYFEEKQAKFYHVCNGANAYPNLLQDKLIGWIENNPDKITSKIEVQIPLLRYNADRFNIQYVIPNILPRKKHECVYFDWR